MGKNIINPLKLKIWKEPITKMEFVWVPGGKYLMGQAEKETEMLKNYIKNLLSEGPLDKGCTSLNTIFENYHNCELPQHAVSVDGFWMGRFPVTRGQYQVFSEQSGYISVSQKSGCDYYDAREGYWLSDKKMTWQGGMSEWNHYKPFVADETHPVVCVSWEDARAMCIWLNKNNQNMFRLPTEEEWEYACRSSTTTPYNFGEKSTYETANFSGNNTTPVGKFLDNDYGLFDMHGNIHEWCENIFYEYCDTKQGEIIKLQKICDDDFKKKYGHDRSLRGGSWHTKKIHGRSASRDKKFQLTCSFDIGFRLVSIPKDQNNNTLLGLI